MAAFATGSPTFFLILLFAGSANLPAHSSPGCTDETDDYDSFLQLTSSLSRSRTPLAASRRSAVERNGATSESCVNLENRGTFSVVDVSIGMPGQVMKMVIDTGSNALVVSDCECRVHGFCSDLRSCYNRRHSNTFLMNTSWNGSGVFARGAKLVYGSGSIQALSATDSVIVGGARTKRGARLWLVQDARELNVHDFEGILGLGLPSFAGIDPIDTPTFAQAAGVSRYSLCFAVDGKPGRLSLNLPKLPHPMATIGKVHWALDLQGISVGNETMSVLLCSRSSKAARMKRACHAIPDSGTTLLLGPSWQLTQLYGAICDLWPRCSQRASSLTGHRDRVFVELLRECNDWMHGSREGINELPSIYFHLAGAGGNSTPFELTAESYVMQTERHVADTVLLSVHRKAVSTSSENKTVCSPAFASTEQLPNSGGVNGATWILGSPLFYEYDVGFDVTVNPPTNL